MRALVATLVVMSLLAVVAIFIADQVAQEAKSIWAPVEQVTEILGR
tara:strand:- start:632 stop:769 length:138 start_codon:yes stop_codon:yes gene_type:complete